MLVKAGESAYEKADPLNRINSGCESFRVTDKYIVHKIHYLKGIAR